MRIELNAEERAWLRQYDGIALDAPIPPQHVLERLFMLRLLTPKSIGLGLTARGVKVLREHATEPTD